MTTELNGPLYHYTSQAGLLGIIKNKSIWATNILYLNDMAEFTHAVDLFQEEAPKFRKSAQNDLENNFLDYLCNDISRVAGTDTRGQPIVAPWFFELYGIYVCSLSTESDQLSQWRGYCPNGNGFSVGFNSDWLARLAKQQGFKLASCEYDPKKQQALIREFLGEALQTYREMSAVKDLASWPACSLAEDKKSCGVCLEHKDPKLCSVRKAWFKFLELAPRLKHEKFSEENEWRLISEPISHDAKLPPESQESRIRFREGKSMLVPYLEFNLSEAKIPGCIEEIWIGPTPHPVLSFMSVGQYLTAMGTLGWAFAGWDRIIKRSSIPYRAW